MIDITRPLGASTAPWPGDTPFSIDWSLQIASGDNVSLSRITMSPHVGTHADAPLHYQRDGYSTDGFELGAFLGPARVIDARGCGTVTLDVLKDRDGLGATRLLVRTLDRVQPERFDSDYPALSAEAASALLVAGLQLYGTDAPSIDPVDSASMSAHRAFGRAGIPILENLDLGAAVPGDYDLLALPLCLLGAEAAPLRAVLLPRGTLALTRSFRA